MGVSLSVAKKAYAPNESIVVDYNINDRVWKEDCTAGSCWIGLIPANITSNEETVNDSHDVSYFHVNNNRGQGTLKASQVGNYNIKCFGNDGGGKYIGCINHEIIITKTKAIIQAVMSDNGEIKVIYDLTNCNYESGSCWIGLIPLNITSNEETVNDSHDVSYFHVYNNNNTGHRGQGILRSTQVGRYKIKCFANDNGGEYLGCADGEFSIAGNAIIDVIKGENREFKVRYDLSNCSFESGSCWIGLIPNNITSNQETVNDSHDVDYFHVHQNKGQSTLRTSQSGTYRIKCFANDNGGQYLGCATREFTIN